MRARLGPLRVEHEPAPIGSRALKARSEADALPKVARLAYCPFMPRAPSFDRAYYDRFYHNHDTKVHCEAHTQRLGAFVCSYLEHLEIPPQRVLDIGCGLGFWRPIVAEHFPHAEYVGVEYSSYLCEKYGWTEASVVDFRSNEPFDLVICQGVLQYLEREAARRAIANLSRLCSGALYLEVLTREDWQHNCDRERTDGAVELRPAAWYRRTLRPHFINSGGGLFVHRDCETIMWELDKLDTAPMSR